MHLLSGVVVALILFVAAGRPTRRYLGRVSDRAQGVEPSRVAWFSADDEVPPIRPAAPLPELPPGVGHELADEARAICAEAAGGAR